MSQKKKRRCFTERVFTDEEKEQLAGARFHDLALDEVDFRRANLGGCRFERVSLTACDFSGADLRGASFLDCDLRRARFDGVTLLRNKFDGSWLTGASGFSVAQRSYVVRRGGSFLRISK